MIFLIAYISEVYEDFDAAAFVELLANLVPHRVLIGCNACGIIGDELLVRVGPANHDQAMKSKAAKPFSLTGRPSKGWIIVHPAASSLWQASRNGSNWGWTSREPFLRNEVLDSGLRERGESRGAMIAPQYPAGPFQSEEGYDPQRRAELILEIEGAPTALRAAIAGLSAAQLNTRYKDWTIRQIVHHLADSHVNSYVRFKWALTEE